ALELDAGAVLDARRDLDAVALRAPLPAGAVAGRTRRLDDRAGPAAAWARLLQREQSLRRGDDTAAATLRARDRSRPRRRAGPMARVARELELHRHRGLDAAQRVL